MFLKLPLIGVVCLVIGILLGRMLPGGGGVDVGNGEVDTPEQRPTIRANFNKKNWGEDVRSAGRVVDGGERGVLNGVSGLVDRPVDGPLVVVPASLLDYLSASGGRKSIIQDLFSRDGKVEAYLQITEKEKGSLRRAWREVRKKVKQLEANAAEPVDLADGSVRITVPDMTGAMSQFGEEFQSTVGDVLGGNRGQAFLAMKQMDSVFKPEAGERVYTVRVESVGNGRWRYHMSSTGPDGNKTWVGDSIPPAIRHLTDAAKIRPQMSPPEVDESEE